MTSLSIASSFLVGCASTPTGSGTHAKPCPAQRKVAQVDDRTIVFATSNDTHPYNFGAADGCKSVACGFEVDLFDAICAEMGLKCMWKFHDWKSKDGVTIFDNLVNKQADGTYLYDVIAASTESTPEQWLGRDIWDNKLGPKTSMSCEGVSF